MSGYSHEEVVRRFHNGAKKGRSNSMFIEGDILYSYGHHFPLLVRTPYGYLMNGDKYSSTTSHHQSVASRLATLVIPFSILHRAGINPIAEVRLNEITIIDQQDARVDERTYKNKEGELVTIHERRPDSCVIMDIKKRYWLSAMDSGSYFMSLLPYPVKNVQEAFDALRPEDAIGEEGKDFFRQGEWFFIPADTTIAGPFKVTNLEKGQKKEERERYRSYWGDEKEPPEKYHVYVPTKFLINRNKEQEPHHYATEYGKIGGFPILVRGQVKHVNGDHRMLRLGKRWHIAVESNHKISYGAGGRVD